MFYNFTEIMHEVYDGDFIPDRFYCLTCKLLMTDKDSAHKLKEHFSKNFDDPVYDYHFWTCRCKHENQVKKEKLMVWHIPQIPGKSFNVPVDNIEEAKKILRVLADYDAFQFHHNIKPDYSNVSGLTVYNEADDDWYEWFKEDGSGIWNEMEDYPSITEQEKRLKYESTNE